MKDTADGQSNTPKADNAVPSTAEGSAQKHATGYGCQKSACCVGKAQDECGRGSEGGTVDVDCLAWDRWLVLRNRTFERQFWESRNDTLLKLDRFCFGNGMLEFLLLWYQSSRSATLANLTHHLLNAVAVVLCTWAALQAHFRSHWYVSRRPIVVAALRSFFYTLMLWNATWLPAPGASSTGFLARMVKKSTATGMFGGWFLSQLQFRQQCILAGLFLIPTAIVGCPGYCSGWYTSDTLPHIVAPIYGIIDHIMLMLSHSSWEERDDISPLSAPSHEIEQQCCVVVLFLHVALGLVLPGAIMYCWECHTKIVFLMGRKVLSPERARQTLYKTLVLALWFSLVSVMLLWACLRMGPAGMAAMLPCH